MEHLIATMENIDTICVYVFSFFSQRKVRRIFYILKSIIVWIHMKNQQMHLLKLWGHMMKPLSMGFLLAFVRFV